MSRALDLPLLTTACSAGGPSCLTITTDLRPAGGIHASIAPAKFAGARGEAGGVYAYEQRCIAPDAWATAVIVDSKQSQLNRAEMALQAAKDDGHALISRVPHLELTYERDGVVERYTDLEMPHRVFDGHFRAGSIEGQPAVAHPAYRALRDATPANARALLEASPLSLVLGSWDSSRRSRQGRWRSALTGEIIGFCLDSEPTHKGGARVDPVAMRVEIPPKHVAAMVDRQRDEISTQLAKSITEGAKKVKDGGWPASPLGLGGIPPSLSSLAGVACSRIVRTHVLSFAALRQIRFGAGPEGDAACRALLAALALNGLVRSYAELSLRANCDLIETGPATATIDLRWGETDEVSIPDIPAADRLLADALAGAESAADVRWDGQVLRVEGDPEIIRGAADSDDAADQ